MKQTTTPTLKRLGRLARTAGILGTVAVLAGCATVKTPNPDDPWERYNRSMFAFNDAVDGAVIKPVALAYDQLMPDPAQNCVSNIFNNFSDVWSAANSFLQGRGVDFFNTLGRVLFNSTMGLGGCFDVASKNGAQRIRNDFGVTLGVWGIKPGPYFVLPLLGPSSVRDTASFAGTLAAGVSPLTPVLNLSDKDTRNFLIGLYGIDTRANLLEADRMVDRVALDRYSFIRDAYIQRRKAMVDSRLHGNALPDYSDAPNYSDVPDYSDDEPSGDAPATPAAGTPAKP
jgi:phospholipid-binding lipoprotein MlaA